jgi:hypothetical protein
LGAASRATLVKTPPTPPLRLPPSVTPSAHDCGIFPPAFFFLPLRCFFFLPLRCFFFSPTVLFLPWQFFFSFLFLFFYLFECSLCFLFLLRVPSTHTKRPRTIQITTASSNQQHTYTQKGKSTPTPATSKKTHFSSLFHSSVGFTSTHSGKREGSSCNVDLCRRSVHL